MLNFLNFKLRNYGSDLYLFGKPTLPIFRNIGGINFVGIKDTITK